MTKQQQQLAEEFVTLLETEQLEWKKGWSGISARPYNPVTGTVYHGVNRFRLLLTAQALGYQDPRWCTFHQIQKNNWKLKRGKGQASKVEIWMPYDRELKKWITWEEFREQGGITEHYCLRTKSYPVFNGDMIEGIPPLEVTLQEVDPVELVDTISDSMQVPIVYHETDRAFYRPSEDRIYLPNREQFFSTYDYASTALHELAHATGAAHRLNRKLTGSTSQESYAQEELVAEITSCFLSSELPVKQTEEHIRNHQAYVQSWIRQIREKPESLIRAIQSAEQASNYLEYHGKRITWEEYQKRVGEVQSNTPSEEKLPEKHPQREEKERMDSILKDVPDFGTNQKRRIVAVESTKDYEDPDFTPNRYNSKGSGREDYYRVVGIQEGGWYVEPVEDKIYHSYREAEKAIKATPAWKQISYDRLIQESGKERTRKLEAREKIRTEVEDLEEKISQLKEKQGYLKQLLKECEENPKLAQARQQILEYEKSIGRMESCMKEAGEAELLAYAKQCEEYLAFGESVDQLTDVLEAKEQMSMREAVSVCKTPDLLQKAGCKPLPMHMSQQHLLDCMHPKQKENAHYHGLTKAEIKKIPEALECPVILAESMTRKDTMIALLDYREQNGNPLLVAIRPNGKALYQVEQVDSNFIMSVYGKDHFQNFLQKMIKEDKLIYIDQEKGKRLGYFGKEIEQFAFKDKEILKQISSQTVEKGKRIGRHL
ncbi:zincin-like metallopeptidase domain-containing protein [Faecalimonas umbilicata]|uniref:zincin-like metallopeptidase domain-containing protein n=1 Tax=Faecalimonas umbilicata TaxID=1912855 RepID=UPI0022E757C2|nr:zincin-like metallopeptidase domain-containing protein [Faecalimonas umbilicata]